MGGKALLLAPAIIRLLWVMPAIALCCIPLGCLVFLLDVTTQRPVPPIFWEGIVRPSLRLLPAIFALAGAPRS